MMCPPRSRLLRYDQPLCCVRDLSGDDDNSRVDVDHLQAAGKLGEWIGPVLVTSHRPDRDPRPSKDAPGPSPFHASIACQPYND